MMKSSFTVYLLCSIIMMSSTLYAVPHSSSVLDYPLSSSERLSCTKDFVLHNTYCYRYFGYELKRSFHPAQKMCSKHSSSLVSLHTIEEEVFVVQMTQNNSAFWIGLSDEDELNSIRREGVFQWSSGEHLSSYVNWKFGEPTNKQHLDCVKADNSGWSMARGGCASSKLPFVCKKRACPPGLDWNGSTCDKVTDHEESSSQQSQSNLVSFLYLSLSVVAMVMCFLVCSARTQHRADSNRTRTKHHQNLNRQEHRHTSNRVQDLYPT